MSEQDVSEGGNRSTFERHAQTLIGSVIAGLVLWVGYTLHQQTITLAEMRVEIRTLNARLEEMRVEAGGRYTANEAAAALALRDQRIANLEARVGRIEGRGPD